MHTYEMAHAKDRESCQDISEQEPQPALISDTSRTAARHSHLLHCHYGAGSDVHGQKAGAVGTCANHLPLGPVLGLQVLPDLSSVSFCLVGLQGMG